jgi:hypothetical protein
VSSRIKGAQKEAVCQGTKVSSRKKKERKDVSKKEKRQGNKKHKKLGEVRVAPLSIIVRRIK